MNVDQACDVKTFYNILDDSKKLCHMSQHCTSSQTDSGCIATSKCIKVTT